MRQGKLVDEGSPQEIRTKYNNNSLEECFLAACCNQERNNVSYISIIKLKIISHISAIVI